MNRIASMLKKQRNRSVLFTVICLLVSMAGCHEDTSGTDSSKTCKKQEDCANRKDNLTFCDTTKGVCVVPASSNAGSCGNGILDANEECDGTILDDKTCKSWEDKYVSGSLACNRSCRFDQSGCVQCTDTDKSKCQANEKCFEGHCVSLSDVVTCGDNRAESNEKCDGTDLRDKTCPDIAGFKNGGTLACNKLTCEYDTSQCWECEIEADCASKLGNRTHCNEAHRCVEPSKTSQDPGKDPGQEKPDTPTDKPK